MSKKSIRERMLAATETGRQILTEEAAGKAADRTTESFSRGPLDELAATPEGRDVLKELTATAEGQTVLQEMTADFKGYQDKSGASQAQAKQQLSAIADALEKQHGLQRAPAMARAMKEHPDLARAARGEIDSGRRSDPTR